MVKVSFTPEEIQEAIEAVPDSWGWHTLAMVNSDPTMGFKVHHSHAVTLRKVGVIRVVPHSGDPLERRQGPWYAVTKLGQEVAEAVGLRLVRDYLCEAFIPTHLSRCSTCHWFPGGYHDGTVHCMCGRFTEEQWIKKNGPKKETDAVVKELAEDLDVTPKELLDHAIESVGAPGTKDETVWVEVPRDCQPRVLSNEPDWPEYQEQSRMFGKEWVKVKVQ